MRMTGRGCTKQQFLGYLADLKQRNIQNVFLLRGSKCCAPKDGSPVAFEHAEDMVKLTREVHGDFFGIAVAGYPEGHPECPDYKVGLQHLKAKVDAGADVVITQMVFDAGVFIQFCKDCVEVGITCPIIPGMMPIYSYSQAKRCMAAAPAGTSELLDRLQKVQSDDSEVRKVGVEFVQGLMRALVRQGVRGFYFFTMNMESHVTEVLAGLDFAVSTRREMPWRQSCDITRRTQEQVRPIHWSGRSKSYLHLTSKWDEFPNGRWGNAHSPAFRDDATYHASMVLNANTVHCPLFRSISTVRDVCDVFLQFLNGCAELPWTDDLKAEADLLMTDVLQPLNQRGLLTINSQPALNGVPSENPYVGWGPLNGYVYQKPYLEMFCSPQHLPLVLSTFDKYPSLSYIAADATTTNITCSAAYSEGANAMTAVTWGIFPNQEVQQPTIVSRESFLTWAPEAFKLWSAPFQCTSDVPPIIQTIQSQWLLITVVDNEFTKYPSPILRAIGELCDCLPVVGNVEPPVSTPTKRSHMTLTEIEEIRSLLRPEQ